MGCAAYIPMSPVGLAWLAFAAFCCRTSEATKILRFTTKSDSRWRTCPIDGSKDWWACWWHSSTHVCGESCCCNGGSAYDYKEEACVVDAEKAMLPCPGEKRPEPKCSDCQHCACGKDRVHDDYEPLPYHRSTPNSVSPPPPPPASPPPAEPKKEKEEEPEEEKKATEVTTTGTAPWYPPTTTEKEVPVSGEPSTAKPPVKLSPEEIDEHHP